MNSIFKILRDNNCKSRIVYTTKLPFNNDKNKDIFKLKKKKDSDRVSHELLELLDCTSYAKVNDDQKISEKASGLGKRRDNRFP